MLIQCGFDIEFYIPAPATMLTLLHVHPSLRNQLRQPDNITVTGGQAVDEYVDEHGNLATRITAGYGLLNLSTSFVAEVSGEPDIIHWNGWQHPVETLPPETLPYLLPSRYCEVDLLTPIAWDLFGHLPLGWARIQGILDWVHGKVLFGYRFARPTKTALETFTERTGVCRDFQHLAIAFCRAMNIPARYASGYLGDIGVPLSDTPMDFSAWFEVYLDDRWWTCDARHNQPRIGRILMSTGRDAVDAAITTTFGSSTLNRFIVVTDEIKEQSA